jgi:hypothetical protein
MDPATQQFFAAQMQLIQNLTAAVQNIQTQQNQQQPPPPPLAPSDKHKEFTSHHPPTFSHSTDPLDADDWLKTVTKKLERAQCNDRVMVLYAFGHLERLASDWWDAYTAAHPTPNTIAWQQFRDAFRAITFLWGTEAEAEGVPCSETGQYVCERISRQIYSVVSLCPR